MTLCERCRKMMKIKTAVIDLGEGDEEFDMEYCLRCRIVYVSNGDWKVSPG